jgi:hypothetical protein
LVYTLLGLSLTAIIGWRGFRSHRLADSELPHDFNNVADRHRFLGFATFLLALLSGIAILFTGLVVAFIGNCQ